MHLSLVWFLSGLTLFPQTPKAEKARFFANGRGSEEQLS